MTICREWTLVNHSPERFTGICLKCRSWNCEHCAPERRKQLIAQAISGQPNRFVTLTANPHIGESADERLKKLARAWRIIVKRLRRRHPKKAVEYLAVVEATKRGEPHLHILYRGPWLAQSELSAWMDELEEAPIVDIRRIKNTRELVNYVAKYITKKPAQFGTSKRYWQSTQYQLERPDHSNDEDAVTGLWSVMQTSLDGIRAWLQYHGYTAIRRSGERLYAHPPPSEWECQSE